mgnify:CR=1 FL=1
MKRLKKPSVINKNNGSQTSGPPRSKQTGPHVGETYRIQKRHPFSCRRIREIHWRSVCRQPRSPEKTETDRIRAGNDPEKTGQPDHEAADNPIAVANQKHEGHDRPGATRKSRKHCPSIPFSFRQHTPNSRTDITGQRRFPSGSFPGKPCPRHRSPETVTSRPVPSPSAIATADRPPGHCSDRKT